MRITFVYRAVESFGLEYLSAVLKQRGHQVTLVFDPDLFGPDHYLYHPGLRRRFDHTSRVVAGIVTSAPDLVGFSVPTVYYRWALEVARQVKARSSVPVIFGGIHPTSVPETVLANPQVDYVLVGEGDEALTELAEDIARGGTGAGIRNVWRKEDGHIVPQPLRPLIADLDALPRPDKELFERVLPFSYLYKTAAGRGCPYTCSFCCHAVLKRLYPQERHYARRRSPARVLAELQWAKERYAFRVAHFDDDVLTADRDWLRELLDGYRRHIGVPFSCVAHPLCLDEERARLLRAAGCFLIELGVQTVNERVRREVLNRHESNAAITNAFAACERVGLPFQVDHIFGFPGEAAEDYPAALAFYAPWRRLARIECFDLAYHPETPIVAQEVALTAERQESIRSGGEAMYFLGGSVADAAVQKRAKQYRLLFKLLTVLPVRWRTSPLLLRLAAYLPAAAATVCEALNCLLQHDRRPWFYLRYYLLHLAGRRV